MPRPPRLQIAGGIYHVTARGNRRQPTFVDDRDFRCFLSILSSVVNRHAWRCHAYCLMPNHYHLLIETPEANLSAGMQMLNGRYAQWFNAIHALDGHLFQGRFHAVLIESQWHLIELSRYIVLNPVRAGFSDRPSEWSWSSYRALVCVTGAPRLSTDWILELFGREKQRARKSFKEFVQAGLPHARAP